MVNLPNFTNHFNIKFKIKKKIQMGASCCKASNEEGEYDDDADERQTAGRGTSGGGGGKGD